MTCEVCGPGEYLHSICHPTELRRFGCGHNLDDHTDALRCRVCGEECGIDCTLGSPPRERQGRRTTKKAKAKRAADDLPMPELW